MKSIEFTEADLADISAIGMKLFEDETDPSSNAYKRVLKRPDINWFKILLFVFIPVVACVAVYTGFKYLNVSDNISIVSTIVVFLVYLLIIMKKAVICSVRIYQRYAPDSLRNKCRFEPSCSEYMILAIEKYGLIKGVQKGIDRLKRCNIDHGGFDYP